MFSMIGAAKFRLIVLNRWSQMISHSTKILADVFSIACVVNTVMSKLTWSNPSPLSLTSPSYRDMEVVLLASLRNSISIPKEENHGISFTSAVGPQIARHRQNLLGGRNLLGDLLVDATQRDAGAAVWGVGHS
jgi:hypothetical protein